MEPVLSILKLTGRVYPSIFLKVLVLALQHAAHQFHIFCKCCVTFHQFRYAINRVHDCGMVTITKLAANFG